MITEKLLRDCNRRFFNAESQAFFNTREIKIVGNLAFLKNARLGSDNKIVFSYPVYSIDPITKALDYDREADKIEFDYVEFNPEKLS